MNGVTFKPDANKFFVNYTHLKFLDLNSDHLTDGQMKELGIDIGSENQKEESPEYIILKNINEYLNPHLFKWMGLEERDPDGFYINFDNICKAIGTHFRSIAQQSLEKNFDLDIDYHIWSQSNDNTPIILLKVDTAKEYCLAVKRVKPVFRQYFKEAEYRFGRIKYASEFAILTLKHNLELSKKNVELIEKDIIIHNIKKDMY